MCVIYSSPLPPSAVHVIVATPGRLLDLLDKGIANASQCHMLVLDEADKLLSMDYQHALDKLIAFMPSDRQVLLFSATFPNHIRGFTVSATNGAILYGGLASVPLPFSRGRPLKVV